MEFALGMAAGFLLWPWYCMALFAVLIVAEVIFCENDAYAAGFFTMMATVSALGWIAGSWTPGTLGSMPVSNIWNLALFSAYYLLVGGLWSIVKWFLYSLKLRDETKEKQANKRHDDPHRNARPSESYAKNNKGLLAGWVAMWPFSMIGTFIGDFLTKLFDHVVKALSGIYDGIANAVWKGM